MTRGRFTLAVICSLALFMGACGTDDAPDAVSNGGDGQPDGDPAPPVDRQELTMWFWGAPPEHQETMREVLVSGYNASQEEYELVLEFRPTVDDDIAVGLAAGEGPDIVYGSGPAFVAPYAVSGQLASMESYAEQYGWRERLLAPMYESGTVDGELFALPNSLNTLGIFYNRVTLEEHGWDPPSTIEELESIMDEAMELGMYASVTGNSGWRPVNENYASLFLTHLAGPATVYNALTGEISWTSEPIAAAVERSAEWYQTGYLAGDDYVNLNFNDAVQLLADGQSPFFIGPTLVFQFASQFFNEEAGNVDDLGFIPFPTIGEGLPYPLYTLGSTASLSINANSDHQDAAAAVIDIMMTEEFLVAMTERWPGYWGVPVADLSAAPDDFTGLSRAYVEAIGDMIDAVNAGDFGYFTATFFPPATQQEFVNIDTVWEGVTTTDEFLERVQATFEEEFERGLVPPIPTPVR